MGSIGNTTPGEFDLTNVDIDIQAIQGHAGLSPDRIVRTIWAIISHVYTGDNVIEVPQQVPEGKSTFSTTFTFQIERSLSAAQISASEQESTVLEQLQPRVADENTGSTIVLAQIIKRIGIVLIKSTESSLNPAKYAQSIDRSQNLLYVVTTGDKCQLYLHFSDKKASRDASIVLADTIEQVSRSVLQNWQTSIGSLHFLGPVNHALIHQTTQVAATTANSTLGDIITQKATARPSCSAVDAWDGSFTYYELYSAALDLAATLLGNKIAIEERIPLCMKKSKWAVAAMLGIFLAGATCVPLDINSPPKRLLSLTERLKARFIVTDRAMHSAFANSNLRTISYPLTSTAGAVSLLPKISPSAAAVIYFTSGSTGTPKGVLSEHGAMYAAIRENAKGFGYHENVRVFQYAAYVFDVSLGDMLGTLMNGGCVCIPSEEARMNDLGASLKSFAVTHACFTNTVITHIQPSQVPSLQRVFVGGETLDKSQLLRWSPHVDFNVVYGTTESLIWDSLATATDLLSDHNNIGRPIGPCMWVVDVDARDQLRPVGAIGEIIVEGPLLAREYMDDPTITAAMFIAAPKWMQELRQDPSLRCYRTGDLGYRNADGTLSFVGRAGTQVKIRGQRVELGEIEHAITMVDPVLEYVAVDAVVISNHDNSKTLTAFICSRSHTDNDADTILAMDDKTRGKFRQIRSALTDWLPSHMVPTIYLPVANVPRTVTGKLDRIALKRWASQMSIESLSPYYLEEASTLRTPQNAEEKVLQQAWANIMKVAPASVGADDHFFQSGGDSIKAMELVAALRDLGKSLSVATIFENPRLSAMSLALEDSSEASVSSSDTPFSLIADQNAIDRYIETAARACDVQKNQIEDIYATTPMQEALLATSAYRTSAYYCQLVFAIPETIDIDRLQSAWESLVKAQSIFRTRICVVPELGSLQVVLRPNVTWGMDKSLARLLDDYRANPMTYGTDLSRQAIVHDEAEGRKYFVWSGHHAMYDGWSQPLMFRDIVRYYNGGIITPQVPYRRFVQYLDATDVEASTSFWKAQFPDVTESFPNLPTTNYTPNPERSMTLDLKLGSRAGSDITVATLIQAAWGLVVARHQSSDDAVFGLTLSGRDIAVPEITNMQGPTITTVPLRINLDNTMTIPEFLQDVQKLTAAIRSHQHTGVQTIRRLSPEASSAVDFQTLMVIHPNEFGKDVMLSELGIQLLQTEETDTRDLALTLQCTMGVDMVSVRAQYDEKVIESRQLGSLLHRLEYVLVQLTADDTDKTIYDIDMVSQYDLDCLAEWNKVVPSPVSACIHDLVHRQALATPHAQAIAGFDRNFTYSELDKEASRLANHLSKLGVRQESYVVLCFSKSSWPIVAMLAVLKCGGVCVSVNPEHPLSRLLEICSDVKAELLLCDSKAVEKFIGQVANVVAVNLHLMKRINNEPDHFSSPALPSDASFVVYTSGSTGKPKGSILEHQALATSLKGIARGSGMDSSSRTLQFSAYTFDAHILEIFGTLLAGGCVCVISDEERMNCLGAVIDRRQVNWSLLTPTVARLLVPEEVPSLRTLILSGEPLAKEDVRQWSDQLRLLNGLGPSECSILACLTDSLNSESSPANIGRALGCHLWVTDRRRPARLMPIGAIGELTIEGPIIGRGYVNRPKATASAFIRNPAWSKGTSEHPRRFYRTGDLARFNMDGSVHFIGRADSQVKIRGQRVELGEIENNLKVHGPEFTAAVVDVVSIASRADTQSLVAFVVYRGDGQKCYNGGPFISMTPDMRDEFLRVQTTLTARLPRFMIPTLYLPVRQLPISPSGKLERKTLRVWVTSLSADDVVQYYLQHSVESSEPATENEKFLLQLWSQVLKVPEKTIGVSENFFQLGGDSVSAMQLIAAARAVNLSLTVAEVFQSPQLSEMAKNLVQSSRTESLSSALKPFDLIRDRVESIDSCIQEAAHDCQVDPQMIEDVYPCTPIQEALMAISAHRPQAYTHRAVFRLPSSLDLNRFRAAWEDFVSMHAIFRTRIVIHQDLGAVQVVTNKPVPWRTGPSTDEYLREDRGRPIEYGAELSRLALVNSGDHTAFIWTIHHATYDGWSLARVFNEVGQRLRGEAIGQPVHYRDFVKYLVNIDQEKSDDFWRDQFPDLVEEFPRLPLSDYSPKPRQRQTVLIQTVRPAHSKPAVSTHSTTTATLTLAAWALVTAPYTDGKQAHFGLALSGRDTAVTGITEIMGPTIATVPVRIRLDAKESITDFLRRIQTQVALIRTHQHTSLQRIRRLGTEARAAVGFQNLVIVQTAGDAEIEAPFSALGIETVDQDEPDFLDLALTTECVIRPEEIQVSIQYDNQVVPDVQVELLLKQMEKTISTLLSPEDHNNAPIGDIDLLSASDLERIEAWHGPMPESVEATVHGLFEQQVVARPDAIALSGFDGEYTYSELDRMSSVLAQRLVQAGVTLESQAVLCFSKSSSTIVAMMAVLKSGGVCAAVNPQHPTGRLLDICRNTAPVVILCEQEYVSRFEGAAPHILIVDARELVNVFASELFLALRTVPSHSAAFTVHTSGTTGMPKGIVLEHRSICTSIKYHGKIHKMSNKTRALQFSAYTFDLHIFEIFGTLAHGGCICIISEDERTSMLAETINALRVNWALLTPTVSRLLTPSSVPGLKTLALCGEPVTRTDVLSWAESVHFINMYGPAETSIAITANSDIVRDTDAADIGKEVGCHVWITDPEHPDRLMPIGAAGEMLIEGPMVSRGYLNQPDATAHVFVTDPVWSRNGTGSRRFYRTGDLARLMPDGRLSFIGRRDTQIKIRGQRVELGEIEYQTRAKLPPNGEVVVDLVKPKEGTGESILTAFVFLKEFESSGSASLISQLVPHKKQEFRALAIELQRSLIDILPEHMVPAAYIPVTKIPTSPSGKTDRTPLRKEASALARDDLRLRVSGSERRQPSNDTERKLQQVWSRALSFATDEIGIDDTFTSLGGDSITAMQIMADCRRRNIKISVSTILAKKTISAIAQTCEQTMAVKSNTASHDPAINSFDLSPAQRSYFAEENQSTMHFLSGHFLRIRRSLTVEQIKKACDEVVQRHDMLRVRFGCDGDGKWSQHIQPVSPDSYIFNSHKVDTLSEVRSKVERSCQSLNTATGPVFSVDWFNVESEDSILCLNAHRLVADSVSWHIIQQDLEVLLQGNALEATKSHSFRQWCEQEKARCLDESSPEQHVPSQASTTDHSYWQVPESENISTAVVTETFRLSPEVTSLLLDRSNAAYRSKPLDIFLGLLTFTFRQTFADRDGPTVDIQRNMRDLRDRVDELKLDVTQTVGLFDDMHPVHVPLSTTTTATEAVRFAKDARYAISRTNRSDFASRYLSPQPFRSHDSAEILLNFSEILPQTKGVDYVLEKESRITPQELVPIAGTPRRTMIQVDVEVERDELSFKFEFHREMSGLSRVLAWIHDYEHTLAQTAFELAQRPLAFTLSDFPILDLSYAELDDVIATTLPSINISGPAEVQDIYPCTAMQEGILLSQQKDGQLYQITCVWQFQDANLVDAEFPNRVKAAWQSMVYRHTALRTDIIPATTGRNNFLQVVLRKPVAGFILAEQKVRDAAEVASLPRSHSKASWSHCPHLSLYPTHDGGAACRLEISHALIDGTSIDLLISEFVSQLTNTASQTVPMEFARFVEYEQSRDHDTDVKFWSTYLSSAESCQMPILKQVGSTADGYDTFQVTRAATANIATFCRKNDMTPAALLQTAWAVVLGSFTGMNDVCLGYFASDRDAPLDGIESSVGLFISPQICRVRLDGTVHDVLSKVQRDILSALEHRNCSLAAIHNALALSSTPLFNTCLTVRRGLSQGENDKVAQFLDVLEQPDETEYTIALHATVSSTEVMCDFTYRRGDIPAAYAESIGGALESVIQSLTNGENQAISDIRRIGAGDRAQLEHWTARKPLVVANTVHGAFETQAFLTPDAPATTGFDGDFTYAQIDQMATSLAVYLNKLEITTEERVILCFSKSTWATMAMLATLKAGGVCVSVNPEHPRERLLGIYEDIEAKVVLCDTGSASIFADTASHVTIVDQSSISLLPKQEAWKQPKLDPRNAAFVVYTSGTTGKPKGSILEHQNLCTSMAATAQRTGMSAGTRTLQFSAYTFDAHILEIFGTWMVGGCVCIISESERMEALTDVINLREANWSLLTPTVTRMLSPEKVPTLKTLILAGEPLAAHDVSKWAGQVRAFNGIGPSECSILACLADLTMNSEPSNIGYAMGCHLWITDHSDPNQLAPIGCVGEILIEGPIVGRGYINRPEATAAAFIEGPAWSLTEGDDQSSSTRRFYRTGDLGRFNSDGSITFIGRRDTQIKIRGQRVELGEIEHQIKANYPGLHHFAVESGKLSCQGGAQILAAFVQWEKHENHTTSAKDVVNTLPIIDEVEKILANMRQTLRGCLPSHMVPTLFIPVQHMPHLATGKLDRKALRQYLAELNLEQFGRFALARLVQTRSPTTPFEQLLQHVWAQVLSVPASSVGAEDHFFQSGGDSARAMQLVASLREMRYLLSVTQIFRTPRLCDLASALKETRSAGQDSVLRPFCLISNQSKISSLIDDIAQICGVEPSVVEDLYPATPVQETLVAVSAHQTGAYQHQMVFQLPKTLDLTRFQAAWQTVATAQPILRTRIVSVPAYGTLQAVLRSSISWLSSSSLEQHCKDNRQILTANGAELSRFAIVTEDDELFFVWTIHHALYDGWSLTRIFDQIQSAYQKQPSQPVVAYGHFIRYLNTVDLEVASEFWRQQFVETVESYPSLPSPTYAPAPCHSRTVVIPTVGAAEKATVTIATLLQSAYALVMARCANTSDALFGLTLSGRDIPVPGITEIVGPTLAIVPIQIRVDRDQTVADFLRNVQAQVNSVKQYQHIGLQRIRTLSPEAKSASNIQNLLTIQNGTDSGNLTPLQELGLEVVPRQQQGFLDLALAVECEMRADTVAINVQYDNDVVSDIQASSVLRQFQHIVTALLSQSEEVQVKDLDLMPVEDLRQQRAWNNVMPEAFAATVHGLVEMQAKTHPDAIAMSGAEGDWTYSQLNQASTRLAIHLTNQLGSQPEARMVLCFSKSVWPVIAMLAVLKSGGVCVSVNPEHPTQRLLDICHDTETAIVLCDAAGVKRFSNEVAHVVSVDASSLENLPLTHVHTWMQPAVRPTNAAFVVYTSGSTGKPKGSILEHQALCTSLTAIGARSGINQKSRTLQFSAYTFDAHILEIFGTLIHGGCICVISDDERFNNLSNVIRQRCVNWSLLTPTVARLLNPTSLPDLKTLILSGEPISRQDYVQWAGHLQLYNGLGPSECSILVCLTPPVSANDPPSNIGSSMGCHLWIVDRNSPDKLVPTGCVGELVVEGPIIGREYINRPQATAAAFVYDLAWSRDGSGRSRRFYRTGDLAKFNVDGSIIYIGRADFQVKIRGQRVELGEIESQIRQRLPSGSEALVEYLPAKGSLSEPTLITFVRKGGANVSQSQVEDSAQPIFTQKTQEPSEPMDGSKDQALQGSIDHAAVIELRHALGDTLPEYMIPAGYVPIRFVPRNPSGKTDRARLRRYVQSLTKEEMHMRDARSHKVEPITDMERELCKVWSQILNCPIETVGIEDTFTSLGGDSITAMQTVAECRKRGIKISVSTILGKKIIRSIAPLCSKKSFTSQTLTKANNRVSGIAFDLSPVQRLYLSRESPGWTQFNQSFLLRLRQQVSVTQLRRALDAIVDRHAMLRARFVRDAKRGQWQQKIAPIGQGSYRLESHQIEDISREVEPCVVKSGSSLDIVRGPVFAVDFFNVNEGDAMLFMVAHHLVIDLVSWRVIWRELEEILKGGNLSPMRSLSFQRWCELQEADCRTQAAQLDKVLPQPVPSSGFSFWGVDESENILGQVEEIEFTLDPDSSALILGRSNDALRTAPLDILLGALLLSFRTAFAERDVPSVFLEQHGREVWDTDQDLDISETIGWFTAMYPLHVPLEASATLTQAIRLVKDLRALVPGKGRPYFACRHLLEVGVNQLQKHDPAEILFNFAGVFQQLEKQDSLLERESRLELRVPESSPANHRWAMIDINVGFAHGVLKFSVDLHQKMAYLGRVRQWVGQYKELLFATAAELAKQQPTFTLSDFPLLKSNYAELSDIVASTGQPPENIRDILPLSFFQEMHIKGNLETPPRHWEYMFVDLPLIMDIKRLQQACGKLANHFDTLRSVYVRSGDRFVQVVLKTIEPRIDVGQYNEEADVVVERLCADDLLHTEPRRLGQLFVRFMIVRTPEHVRLIVRLSHAQYDGMSMGLIAPALAAFCEGQTLREPTEFAEYIRHCQKNNIHGHEYWRSLLKGSELTTVPQIRRRAGDHGPGTTRRNRVVPYFKQIPGITPASIFSAACGMLLASLKNSSDVIFGRLSSGRAGLDASIQDIVGCNVNIVPVRAQLTDDTNALLAEIQRQHIESIQHETVGLDELIEHCTNWSAEKLKGTESTLPEFPVILQFRNYNINLEAKVADSALHLTGWDQLLAHPFPRSLCLGGFPGEDGITVSVSAGSSYCTQTDIDYITDLLCDILAKIA